MTSPNLELSNLRDIAATCQLCSLWKGRVKPVFDKGNPKASLMICGMVPAYDENMAGIPFVGRAGQLLDKILARMDLTLNDVYISNLVKCFLAAGKKLEKEWIEACFPYIIGQIAMVMPKVILTLGLDSSITLLGMDQDTKMYSIRGRVFQYGQMEVVPTYHPSFLLRKGGEGSDSYQKVIEDFELALYVLAQKEAEVATHTRKDN